MTKPNGIKGKAITAIIGVLIAGSFSGTIWLHNAYADNRYVLKAEDIRARIQAIDHALFEADQELSFAMTDEDKRKFEARKNYYLREKQRLTEKLGNRD